MEVLSKLGEALLSATFDWLLWKLDDSIKSNNLQEEVHTELQEWKLFFPQICALLKDAEEKQITNRSVKIWLDDLKDLAYDMEDILDGFQADVQRRTLTRKPHQASTSKVRLKCFPCFKHNDSAFDSVTISRVKLTAQRLKWMVDRSRTLSLVSSTIQAKERAIGAAARRVPTTPQLESDVYGRESDKHSILQKLLNDEGSSRGEVFFVLSIVGMGGVGKTTLARLVYKDMEQGRFNPQAWVCVSDQFDIISITRNILEELTKTRCDLNNLNLVQEKLKEKLSGKKFLLVLDDVWNEECHLWDNLKVPFKSGAPGSKIIVTTRNMRVAEIMGGKNSVHYLEVLKDDECLSILARDALGVENFDAHPNLKNVGEEIVKKCKALPLVAKILGGLLRGREDLDDWKHISKNKIWDSKAALFQLV